MQMSDRQIRVWAIALIVAMDVILCVAFLVFLFQAELGLGTFIAAFVGFGLYLVLQWTAILARGVWLRRGWAQLASLVTFGAIAVIALMRAIAVVRDIQAYPADAPPRIHLIAPALVTVCAGGVVALVAASVRARMDGATGDVTRD